MNGLQRFIISIPLFSLKKIKTMTLMWNTLVNVFMILKIVNYIRR